VVYNEFKWWKVVKSGAKWEESGRTLCTISEKESTGSWMKEGEF